MPRIDAFLKLGTAQGCSDIHLAVGVPPMLRMSGELMPIRFRDLADLRKHRQQLVDLEDACVVRIFIEVEPMTTGHGDRTAGSDHGDAALSLRHFENVL